MLNFLGGLGVPFPSLVLSRPSGAAPRVDDRPPPTRMTSSGTFRNGPGTYRALTVVSGTGPIAVYDGPDSGLLSRLIHSIPMALAGNTYTLDQPEEITTGTILLGPGITVDIDVDD